MGYHVREFRKKKKMTQQELADASGVSRATINAMENGIERNTSIETLVALANTLGTTVDALFFLE